ncbi:glycosyltransferase family 4 protein [Paenibacillus sp. FSL K6-3182]|uniref:glycosyltransferase family 4 protein n=1 Tax=Paenibacillus sp. FSL K6-3182 TaxID=2921495 RepID=UPI0030D17829
MKKLVFLVKNIYNQAGDTRAVLLVANQLMKTGLYKIDILSLFKTNEIPLFSIDNKITVHNLFDSPFNLKKNYFKVLRAFDGFIKKNEIDIVFIEAIGFNCFTFPILKKYKEIKTIAVEHASYFDGGKILGMAWFGRIIACKFTDCVVVLTKKDKLDYCNNMGKIKRIEQIYNPLDPELKKMEYSETSKKIISCGRLVEVKGYDLLLEVASKVFKKHPTWQWHIYGDGPERKRLENRIAELNLEENVTLKGEVNNIYDLYNDYSIYGLTSRSESFGLVLLEALKVGIPVVSFNCNNGPSEIIKDKENGYLIPFNDLDAMSQKICYLIENASLRKEFSNNTEKYLNEFNIRNVTDQWENIINTI